MCAQVPRVAAIEIFGLQKVKRDRIEKALGVRPGDPLPSSKGDAELRLGEISGVAAARLEAFCCDGGNAILYVGIEERGSPHFEYRVEPDAEVTLPDEVIAVWNEVREKVNQAAREGATTEDLTDGHPLIAHQDGRNSQLKLIDLAEKYLKELREVLKTAADPDQRQVAASILPYYRRKFEVVDDLLAAVKDPDQPVRSAAIRSLRALQVKAKLDLESEIRIPSTWFIEMLNSLSFSDRDQAVRMLVELTDTRQDRVLIQLRERAMHSLIDMAAFNRLDHALPAYLVLGRIMGVSEQELQGKWASGERESVIQLAREALREKKR